MHPKGLFPARTLVASPTGWFLTFRRGSRPPFLWQRKENDVKITDQIRAAKELPSQVRFAFTVAMSALILAILALAYTIVGGHRAN